MKRLSIENLSLNIKGKRILNDINFCCKPGELIGLIGANGSGKTTLIKAIGQLISHGADISLDKHNLKFLNRRTIAKKIGYMGQNRHPHWPITVRALVGLGRIPHGDPTSDLGISMVDQALKTCDLSHIQSTPITELSGGELTRVFLARVLAGSPELLLLDEPLTGLDPKYQLEIMRILSDKIAEGLTIIIVLHDLALALRFATRLILLDRGEIKADGKIPEVITPKNLETCFDISAKLGSVDGIPYFIPTDHA
jgi:iron complex transport system ATP-binding protein